MYQVRYFKLIKTVRLGIQPALITTEAYFKEVGVIWLGPNFRKQFLGLEIPALGPSELEVHELRRPVRSTEVEGEVSELSANKPEVSQLRGLIPQSRKYPETSFTRLMGNDGNFWDVYFRYDTGPSGWYMGANPFGSLSPLATTDKFISVSRRPVVDRAKLWV